MITSGIYNYFGQSGRCCESAKRASDEQYCECKHAELQEERFGF